MGRARAGRTRANRVLVLRWAAALLLIGVPLSFPSAGAAFTGSTPNTGDSVAAGAVAPPTSFSAAQTCTVTLIGVRGAATGSAGKGSLTFPIPAGTTTGDLLVVQFTNTYDAGY